MTKLAKLMIGLFTYYFAGWITVYIFAVLCGAPFNIADWAEVPRVVVGTFIAPLIAAAYGSATEELYN